MKSYLLIQKAFKKIDMTSDEWRKHSGFPKSTETVNSIIHRDAVVDACTLAYMSHGVGMTAKQTIDILDKYAEEVPRKAAEVAMLKQLIVPVDISAEEQYLLSKLRAMDSAKRTLVCDLVDKLI